MKRTIKPKGLKEILKFPGKIKGIFKKTIWTEGISFYLVGACHQHEYNPFDEAKSVKIMTLPLRSDGLESLCISKDSYTGSGTRTALFILAIRFNKRVILGE